MKRVFSILGIVVSCFVIILGLVVLGEGVGNKPDSGTYSHYLYSSGYASFGGDFYTYVNNNAALAAKNSATIADNQRTFYVFISQIFGYMFLSIGSLGLCYFGMKTFKENEGNKSRSQHYDNKIVSEHVDNNVRQVEDIVIMEDNTITIDKEPQIAAEDQIEIEEIDSLDESVEEAEKAKKEKWSWDT